MCDLLAILKQKDLFLVLLDQKKSEAAGDSFSENASATTIQRVWRGNRARLRIFIQSCAATQIERVHRGHMGRKKSRLQKRKKNESRLLSMFFYFALQVQRCFRGYYSRKYKHNFFSRKEYINGLIAKGEEVRKRLRDYNREVVEREDLEQRQKKDDEFYEHAKNLHHLTSTKRIRGVFNPPEEYLNVPTLHDIAVEDHIRGVVRDLLRSRGIMKSGLVTDLHGSRKVPLKGLKNRLSVQASAPYETVRMEKQRTLLVHRLLTAGKGSFFSGGRTDIINNVDQPLCVGDPFMDAWGNPLLRRGVPVSQKQLLASSHTRKALFITHETRPYYTRAEGNKSTALPNDVFDVIAEAEETGGAAQRHMGTSVRFGLSTSADNRPREGNSTIPPPPLRTSVVQYATSAAISRQKRQQQRTLNKSMSSTDLPPATRAFNSYDSSDDEDEK